MLMTTNQEYGGAPPWAMRSCLYGTPTVPVAEHHATAALLRLAWQTSQDAYHALFERAAADHHEHPRLADLLHAGDWAQAPAACARMAADIVPSLRRSDHPALEPILTGLTALQDGGQQQDIDEIVAGARFRFANLVLADGGPEEANALYTTGFVECLVRLTDRGCGR